MPYAISALLDPASESGLTALRARLAEYAGADAVPTTRPHLTLAVVSELDPETIRPTLQAFCQAIPPLPLPIAAVGTFPTDEGVVFLAPVVTRPLLIVHAKLCALLEQAGYAPVPYYRPHSWVPHCTVAINLSAEQVAGAVAICRDADVYHTDQLTQLAVARFPPMEQLYSLPLRGAIAPSEITD